MGERISFLAAVLMALLFIPAIVICLFSERDAIRNESNPDLEDYLVGIVYQQIPNDYPREAIKAQVVLARSTWMRQLEEGMISDEDWENAAENLRIKMNERSFRQNYEEIREMVTETKNEVIVYEDLVCYGVFHKVSAGHTRNGTDVFEKTTYEYITGVESVMDQESEDYLTGHYFTPAFLEKEFRNHGIRMSFSDGDGIVVKTRDAGGYVRCVEIGETTCTGEEIRQMLHLSSAAFSVEVYEEKIRFLCRGQGHGMGLSQYGAARMAEEGSTYREILMYYFPQTEIIDIENE